MQCLRSQSESGNDVDAEISSPVSSNDINSDQTGHNAEGKGWTI